MEELDNDYSHRCQIDVEVPDNIYKNKIDVKSETRVTRNGTFMPKNYQLWRKKVAKQMKEQWTLPPIDTPIAVHISCAGAARGDVDNYMGAIFDTGNKIIWSDDRANIIQSASIDFTKAKIRKLYPNTL